MGTTERPFDHAGQAGSAGGVMFSWSVHPARENGVSLALVVLIVLGLGYLVYRNFDHWLPAAVALVGLLFFLSAFFLKTRYRVDTEEVVVERGFSAKRVLLSQFRRVDRDRNGIFLSRYRRRRWFETFSGLFLMTRGDQTVLVSFLRDRILTSGPVETRNPDAG